MVMQSAGKSMGQLAAEAGVSGSYFARVLRLGFLAPEVARAILHALQPIGLTAKRLTNEIQIPIVERAARKPRLQRITPSIIIANFANHRRHSCATLPILRGQRSALAWLVVLLKLR